MGGSDVGRGEGRGWQSGGLCRGCPTTVAEKGSEAKKGEGTHRIERERLGGGPRGAHYFRS